MQNEKLKKQLKDFYEELAKLREPRSELTPIQRYFKESHEKLVHENVGRGDIVLDLGCGDGGFLKFLSSRYEIVTGLDLSKTCLRRAKKEWSPTRRCMGDAQCLPFKEGVFAFVLASEIIEHLPYPEDILSEIRRVLVSGGQALVTTPNKTEPQRFLYYGLTRLLSTIFGKKARVFISTIFNTLSGNILEGKEVFTKYGLVEHLHCFSYHDLKQLAQKVGLEVEYSEGAIVQPPPVFWLFDRFPILIKVLKWFEEIAVRHRMTADMAMLMRKR